MNLKKVLLILFLVLIFLFIIIFFFNRMTPTGEVILSNRYSFTKAICNETNYCQDFEFVCNGSEVVEINPLKAVQFPIDWKDPRTIEQIEKNCINVI